MKRCLCLALCLLWLPLFARAESPDLSALTRNELLALQERVAFELESRPLPDETVQSRLRSLAEAAFAEAGIVLAEDWDDCVCSLDWGLGMLDATVYAQSGIVLSPCALHAAALLDDGGDRPVYLTLDGEVLLDEREIVTDERARALIGLADGEPAADRNLDTSSETEEADYVINVNTKKFHHPYCESVGDIQPANRLDTTANRSDLIAGGYVPCKRCNP